MMRSARPFSAAQRPARVSTVSCSAAFSTAKVIQSLEQVQQKQLLAGTKIGDTVRLGVRVVEGTGRTRTQMLEGVIIAEQGSGKPGCRRGPVLSGGQHTSPGLQLPMPPAPAPALRGMRPGACAFSYLGGRQAARRQVHHATGDSECMHHALLLLLQASTRP